ncbi:hypothetical protein Poli38472_004717 [Pythium oligandrum]|uniref:GST N-terminal domain-containing protein n=1 Tax=Pythium oligandrum TaxID=41045 RepID=A0A8K1CBJ9_PYTOL|nr:hypothetical protein Poli38472_004717 [Pythium oligandrum]|eukprot:TMW59648.1 hypothetical protein Poli38472_004717 [Pythium oligandrum]
MGDFFCLEWDRESTDRQRALTPPFPVNRSSFPPPPSLTMAELPPIKLYVYEHCPFCARVRVLLGLKEIDHELVYLMNHDEPTPIGLVGSKQVPILVADGGKPMAESMDIVRFLDANYGGPVLLKESADREDLKQWIKDVSEAAMQLQMPRFHKTPFAEFARRPSRDYYRVKKEKVMHTTFEEALARTPELLEKANDLLLSLVDMFKGDYTVNEEISYDDIDLVTRLRAFTIVKGIQWPPKLRAYVDYYSEKADLALFDLMAQ